MTKRRTTQLLAELKELAGQTRHVLLKRLADVIEVLADLDWVALVYQGDIDAAREAMAKEFFFDLEGYITLGKLIMLYQQVSEDEWKTCHYNIAAVEAIFDARLKTDSPTRHNWKKDYDEAMQRLATTERELERWKQIAEERQVKINEQAERIIELQNTIHRLEGRLEQLERMSRVKGGLV